MNRFVFTEHKADLINKDVRDYEGQIMTMLGELNGLLREIGLEVGGVTVSGLVQGL